MAENTTDETVNFNSEDNSQGPTNPKDIRKGYSSVGELLRANYMNIQRSAAKDLKPIFKAAMAGQLPIQKEQAKQPQQTAKQPFSMKDVEAAAMAEMKPKTEAAKPTVKIKELVEPVNLNLQKSKSNIDSEENAMIAVDNQAKIYANQLPADMPMRDVFIAQKKEDFLSRYRKGELKFGKDENGYPVLKRKIDGTIANFIDGVQGSLNANAQVADFDMMDKDEQIAFMKGYKRIQAPTISEAGKPVKERYLYKPSDADLRTIATERTGTFAETASMMGDVIPYIGMGVAVSALPGLGQTLTPFVVGAVQGKRQQFDSKNQAFQRAKQSGLSDEDAYDIANNFWNSKVSLLTGTAEGIVSQYLGNKLLHKFAEAGPARDLKSFGQAAKAFITDAASNAKELAMAGTLDGAVAYSMEKIRGGSDDSAEEQFKAEFLTQLGFAAIGGAVSVPKYVKSYAYNAVSNLDNQTIYDNMVSMEQKGLVPEGTAKQTVENVNKFRDTKGKVMLSNQDAVSTVTGLTMKAESIQQQIKNTPETNISALNALNTELQQVNERISRAQASQDPLAEEVDDATGLNIKTKKYATTISQQQQQESTTTGGISQYQGTQGVQTQAPNETNRSYSAFGSKTQQEKVIIDAQNASTATIDRPKSLIDGLVNRAVNVVSALKSIKPNLKIAIMPTIQEYGDTLLQQEMDNGESVSKQREKDLRGSNGAYDPINDVIYLNAENIQKKAKLSTLFHEGAHPIINMIAEQNSNAVSDLYNQLRDISESVDGVNGALAFGDGYSIYGEPTVQSEAIVEFIARVADGQIELPTEQPTVMKNILDVIKGFLDIIGLGTDINSIDDIKSIAAKIKEAFQTGKEIIVVSETSGSATEAGITSDAIVINSGSIQATERTINKEGLSLDIGERNFNEKNLKFINMSDIDGAKAFIFAADKAISAFVKSPSGYVHEFNGGVGYSYQDGTGVWAFTTKQAAQKFLNRAQVTDGVGLIMSQKEEGITGSYDFYKYMIGEFLNAVDKGVAEKDLVKYLDSKLDTNVSVGQTFRQLLSSKGKKTSITSLADLENLMPIDGPSKFSYDQRGDFTRKVFSAFTEKNFGIPRLETVLNFSTDPLVKNAQYGDIVAAIQVDKNSPIIDTRVDDSFKNHPSYPFVVTGAPIGVFNNLYDVRNVAPDFIPVSKEANQTPLGERAKPQAAKSAMGAQPIVSIGKKQLALQNDTIKETNTKIKNVYENNPQISQIGTQEEYAKYIQNIFPDSKMDDIVYHSTSKSFDKFDVTKVATRKEGAPQGGDVGAFGRGIYFTPNETYSKIYGKNTKSVVLDIKNPKVILNNEANDKLYQNKSIKDLWGDYDAVIYKVTDWKAVTESGMHASMEEFNSIGLGKNNKPEIVDIVISDENQAHILGSDKDIEGFKNWKKSGALQLQQGETARKSFKQTQKEANRSQQDVEASFQYDSKRKERAQTVIKEKTKGSTLDIINREIIDNQALTRKKLREAGERGAIVEALLTTSRGYGAEASLLADDVNSVVYDGLSENKNIKIAGVEFSEVELLDEVMNQKRMISIQDMLKDNFDRLLSLQEKLKKAKGEKKKAIIQGEIEFIEDYLNQRNVLGKKYNPKTKTSEYYLQNYQVGSTVDAKGNKIPNNAEMAKKKLAIIEQSYDKYNDLEKRASYMFNAYRGMLKDKYENGLVDKETYDILSKYDYVPISYIEHILNDEVPGYSKVTPKNPNQMTKSVLSGGADGDTLTDFKAVFDLYANNHFKSIFNNRAAVGLVEMAIENPNNGIVEMVESVKDSDGNEILNGDGNPRYPSAPEGKGYIYYYQDGKRRAVLSDLVIANEWYQSNMKNGDIFDIIGKVTLAPFTQALLTGKNAGFGIFQMALLDPLTVTVSTDVFSPSIPIAYAQIASGWKNAIVEVAKSGKDYRRAAAAGAFTQLYGGKELESSLKYEGAVGKAGKVASKFADKVLFGKITDATEKATRLIVYLRAEKVFNERFIKEKGRAPAGTEIRDIMAKAAHEARRSSDFARGGNTIKPLSKAFLYLNSTIQTGNAVLSQIRKNPARFVYQTAEFLTIAGGIQAMSAGFIRMPWDDDDDEFKKKQEMYNALSDYTKLNYFNIYRGGDIPEEAFIKIPLPPVLKNIWATGMMSLLNVKRNANYGPIDFARNGLAVFPLADIEGLVTKFPPLVQAVYVSLFNFDPFKKDLVVDNEKGMVDYLEGYKDKNVPGFLVSTGKNLKDYNVDFSPKRFYEASKKITGDLERNPASGIIKTLIQTGVEIYTGAPVKITTDFQKDWKKPILDAAGLSKRIYSGSYRYYESRVINEIAELKNMEENLLIEELAKGKNSEGYKKIKDEISNKTQKIVNFVKDASVLDKDSYNKIVELDKKGREVVSPSIMRKSQLQYIKNIYGAKYYELANIQETQAKAKRIYDMASTMNEKDSYQFFTNVVKLKIMTPSVAKAYNDISKEEE